MGNINKTARLTYDHRLRNGVSLHLKAGIVAASEKVSQKDLLGAIDERTAATNAADAARAVYLKAVADEREVMERTDEMLGLLRDYVHVVFRGQIDVLADFGLAPRRTTGPRKLADKAAAAAKGKATREARHTMGRRQREKIHGVVPSTSAQAPAAAAPAASPPTPIDAVTNGASSNGASHG